MIWILVVAIFLFFLFKFTKYTLITCGITLFIAGIFFFNFLAEDRTERINQDKVTLYIKYDLNSCNTNYPLSVIILNSSKLTIKEVDFSIGVYLKGYSNNLATDYSYFQLYKVIYPKTEAAYCYKIPNISYLNVPLPPPGSSRSYDYTDFDYRLGSKNITFYKLGTEPPQSSETPPSNKLTPVHKPKQPKAPSAPSQQEVEAAVAAMREALLNMDIADFRWKYPQYNNMPDFVLVKNLYNNYFVNTDITYERFQTNFCNAKCSAYLPYPP